jgi:hypothetical protein
MREGLPSKDFVTPAASSRSAVVQIYDNQIGYVRIATFRSGRWTM